MGLVASEYVATHWPFSMHFSKMANQNIKQDTFKYTNGQSNAYRHDKWPTNSDTLFGTLCLLF